MYLQHFGLNQPPFTITPNTELFFAGADRGAILEALDYAVQHQEGIIKVIGEVGTGKTMLCRMLAARLREVTVLYVGHPNVSADNIINLLAIEAKLIEMPVDALMAMQKMQHWLVQQHQAGQRVAVFIEEAQQMPLATLEQIRLLSNLETDQHKLLQIVLFAQPELDDNLAQAQIRQFNERVTQQFYLKPLNRQSAQNYLNFRVRAAGYHGPDLFNARITRRLHRRSRGLIRRLNILADKTLLAAFSDQTTRLNLKHVHQAIQDSRPPNHWLRRARQLIAGS